MKQGHLSDIFQNFSRDTHQPHFYYPVLTDFDLNFKTPTPNMVLTECTLNDFGLRLLVNETNPCISNIKEALSWKFIRNKMVMTISPTSLEEHHSRMQTYLGILNFPTDLP